MFLWDRVKEIFNPPVFQRAAMKFSGAAGMVYLPQALALPAQYLAGNPEQAKRVLAEADGEFIMSAAAGFEPIGKHGLVVGGAVTIDAHVLTAMHWQQQRHLPPCNPSMCHTG
jgi:hypothetical protein